MRLLHYIEIENFKRFGDRQRIELDHPAVLIGPNNCGKTTVIQAIALWSQAVRTWYDARKHSGARERTATAINRLSIVAVPVRTTRYFWHNTRVRTGQSPIPLAITIGVQHPSGVKPLRMEFRNQGDELVYATPDAAGRDDLDLLEWAASLNVELLYSMSGLEIEEPVLQPGRIDVLLGQGQTAQVLRNLCLMISRDNTERWVKVTDLIARLFDVKLGSPNENVRGSIDLQYRQQGVTEPLDLAVAGRGLQQVLLVVAYLYAHPGSVVLIDEPDAHLEILRQRQIYVMLRDVAEETGSQVILVTHSEVILDEALDNNLTLLLAGRADDLAGKTEVRNSLKHFGAQHYVKARERGYVLYVEGSTDVDMLRALAKRLGHPVAQTWDERLNAYYVQDNYPARSLESELERVEGGFGITPRNHFFGLRELVPGLRGLAILDNDGRNRPGSVEGGLKMTFWRRYEAENYFVTPETLARYALEVHGQGPTFVERVMGDLILERVFHGVERDYQAYRSGSPEGARVIWEARTERLKLSDFAEEFFRRLAELTGQPMTLRKGGLHQLVAFADVDTIPAEVSEKLDALAELFAAGNSDDA